jgi:iron complex outermembrane receptor protein
MLGKKSIYIILFLLSSSNLFAQNTTLYGYVSANGEKIVGANIYFTTLQRGVRTDANGSFQINDIPQGNHEIRVSFVGYMTLYQTIDT